MANDFNSVENLELYASNYIINEHSIRTQLPNNIVEPPNRQTRRHGVPWGWNEFRVRLFSEMRRRVRVCATSGRQPTSALNNAPYAISKFAVRYSQVRHAIQVEVCILDSPVCAWAAQQLVLQLGLTVAEHGQESSTISARHFEHALLKMHCVFTPVKCTRAQLIDVWRRLCKLKLQQLFQLMSMGDQELAVPTGVRPTAADWAVINVMLLYDDDNKMQLFTMKSLQNLETYRSLVVLVRLLALEPSGLTRPRPWRPRAASVLWSRVHARYEHTGRKASVLLLQRRWHQLRMLIRKDHADGNTTPHPLLQLVISEFPNVLTDRPESWSEAVRGRRYILITDHHIGKQELRRRWYMDFKTLEQLKSVQEIDEYIIKRIQYCQDKHKCGFWEHTDCSVSELCTDNICKLDNLNNVTNSNMNGDSNTAQNNDNSSVKDKATTIEASINLDPVDKLVTIVVESDSDENIFDSDKITEQCGSYFQSKFIINRNRKEFDTGIVKLHDNKLSESINVYNNANNEKHNASKLPAVQERNTRTEQGIDENKTVQSHNLDVNDGIVKKENITLERSKFIGNDTSDSKVFLAKAVANIKIPLCVNEEESVNEKVFDKNLLYWTYVKLTRIDDTIAWRKHARNNTIDLRRAGLLDDNVNNHDIKNVLTSVFKSRYHKLYPELAAVSEGVLTNQRNQRLLKLCKPAVVRLRKLREGEVPRLHAGRIVKKIELPDINEVRRINSSILTAEVKPISLNDNKENIMDVGEVDTSECELSSMELVKELEQLHKDIKTLFTVAPETLRAMINEAISNNADLTNNNNSNSGIKLYLDEDEYHNNNIKKVNEPPMKQMKKADKKQTTNAKRTANAANITKKKKKKRVKVKVDDTPPEEPKVLTALEEWERQKQIGKKYFEIGTMMNEPDKRRSKTNTANSNTKKDASVTLTDSVVVKTPAERPQIITPIQDCERQEQRANTIPNKGQDGSIVLGPTPNMTDSFVVITPTQGPQGLPAVEDFERHKQRASQCFDIDNRKADATNANKSHDEHVTLQPAAILNDTFLTRLLNAPAREPGPPCCNSGFMPAIDGPMQYICVGDGMMEINASKQNGLSTNEPGVTPVIAAVCSLADTEVIEDEVAGKRNTTMSGNLLAMDNANGSTNDPNLAVSLAPTDNKILVKVGDQMLSITMDRMPNVLKLNMSSDPGNTETSQAEANSVDNSSDPHLPISIFPMNRNIMVKVGDQMVCNAEDCKPDVTRDPVLLAENITQSKQTLLEQYLTRESRPPPLLPPASSPQSPLFTSRKKLEGNFLSNHTCTELTSEFTTPEQYVLTDRRKLLTVVKLDMLKPVWTIGNEYVLVTEQNLPCTCPSYWTMGRDPPGPCQMLVWLKSRNITPCTPRDNAFAEYSQNSSKVHDDVNSNGLNANNVCQRNDSKFDYIKTGSENTRSNDQLDCYLKYELLRGNKDLAKSITEPKDIDDSIASDPQPFSKGYAAGRSQCKIDDVNKVPYRANQRQDENGSDSDSESDKLQIVEEMDDLTDFNDTNSNTDKHIESKNNKDDYIKTSGNNVTMTELTNDNSNKKNIEKNNFIDLTQVKDTQKASTGQAQGQGPARGMIKVKSFANVGRLEPNPITLDAHGNLDVIEKNSKYYKKLLEANNPGSSGGSPTYALMLSAVSSAEECDQLLRDGVQLQVLERYRGIVYPLDVTTCCDGAALQPIGLRHHDERFLNDLANKLQAFKASQPQENNHMYVFVHTDV